MLRRLTAIALLVSLMLTMTPQAWAAAATPLAKLEEIEVCLYGAPQVPGALLQRLDNVETTLYGQPTKTRDPIVVRIEKLASLVSKSGISGASLVMKLNAVEWMIFQTQTMSTPLFERLANIEEAVYGGVLDTGVVERINDLIALVWSGGELNIAKTPVLPGTKVKVRLLTELNSTSSREGDVVNYQVLSDVIVDNKLIIPTGADGKGVVQQVKKAGAFGQEGQVAIDFGTVNAIDGTPLTMTFQPPAGSGSVGQTELAAGASLGGMVLLGPLGLAAGYLVQGKTQVIPVGAEFALEVKDAGTVQALSLLPAR